MSMGSHFGGLIGSHLGDGLAGSAVVAALWSAGAGLFVLDAESGAEVMYQWATDVQPSTKGTEHRSSLGATPRERYAFTALLEDDYMAQVQSQLVVNAASAQLFLVGLMHEGVAVTGPASGFVVPVADTTKLDWVFPGARAVVYDPTTRTVASGVVQSTSSTSITLDTAPGVVAKNGAIAMPAQPCYLESVQKLGNYVVNAGRWDIRAVATRWGDQNGNWTVNGASVTTFNGLPVFDRIVEANTIVGRSVVSGAEVIESGGAITSFGQRTSSAFARQLRTVMQDAASRQWFKAFMGATRGRQRQFYLPSWKPDFPFIGDASSGSLTFAGSTIANTAGLNYAGAWALTGAHGAVQLKLTDGSIAYRTISAYGDNGNGTQTITLSSAVAGALQMVSFLERARLDRDEIVVRFEKLVGRADMQAWVTKQ